MTAPMFLHVRQGDKSININHIVWMQLADNLGKGCLYIQTTLDGRFVLNYDTFDEAKKIRDRIELMAGSMTV